MLSQVIYCGGYSGEEPPLPIPNREVKLTIADGTAPPGGRVGSCRSSDSPTRFSGRGIFILCLRHKTKIRLPPAAPQLPPRGRHPPPPPSPGGPVAASCSECFFSRPSTFINSFADSLYPPACCHRCPADGPCPAAAGILVVAALFRRLRRLHPSQCLLRPASQNSYPSGPSL